MLRLVLGLSMVDAITVLFPGGAFLILGKSLPHIVEIGVSQAVDCQNLTILGVTLA